MKSIVLKGAVILFIFFVPILLSGFTFPDYPGNTENESSTILSDTDVADFHERLINDETPSNLEIMIYDQNSELIYKHSFASGEEAIKDQKLSKLLRKCDLLLKSESSALYIVK
ncbi:MAG: hypothetical protein WBG62_00705 [Cyclobacteriaceae bacterium]